MWATPGPNSHSPRIKQDEIKIMTMHSKKIDPLPA